jgi:hypothetical protein
MDINPIEFVSSRWETCEAFDPSMESDICATCGWLAAEHVGDEGRAGVMATVTSLPVARPAHIRRAS